MKDKILICKEFLKSIFYAILESNEEVPLPKFIFPSLVFSLVREDETLVLL